jgi:hypothetical protein
MMILFPRLQCRLELPDSVVGVGVGVGEEKGVGMRVVLDWLFITMTAFPSCCSGGVKPRAEPVLDR